MMIEYIEDFHSLSKWDYFGKVIEVEHTQA